MLTHGNVVAAVSAILIQLSQYRPNVGDVMISYLPLAHMLERCCEVSRSCDGRSAHALQVTDVSEISYLHSSVAVNNALVELRFFFYIYEKLMFRYEKTILFV